ncbi:MAG: permease, partial [Candidatus Omnitrophica bacterium]|nr:permease [Candidatus Omnitrophota bacterium]
DLEAGEIKEVRPLWQNAVYFFSLVAVLVFANWGKPPEGSIGTWAAIYTYKWGITGFFLGVLAYSIFRWFKKHELKDWTQATWTFALQILPLLLGGVLISGFLLGRAGHEGIIPKRFVEMLVGGNSLRANFFSSIVAAFMYFATLTEVPILQGLIGSGMGKGPALALLLAGPALSLPSMLVIRSVIGTKKTVVYVSLVVLMATITGMIFGYITR